MNNSALKISYIFFFLSILSCTAQIARLSPEQCVENVLPVTVTKSDNENHRFFLVGASVTANDIKEKINPLSQCFLDSDWKDDWSLSLFSEEKYAGYKTEEHIIPFLVDGTWLKAYKAEYSKEDNTLISNPALAPKLIH